MPCPITKAYIKRLREKWEDSTLATPMFRDEYEDQWEEMGEMCDASTDSPQDLRLRSLYVVSVVQLRMIPHHYTGRPLLEERLEHVKKLWGSEVGLKASLDLCHEMDRELLVKAGVTEMDGKDPLMTTYMYGAAAINTVCVELIEAAIPLFRNNFRTAPKVGTCFANAMIIAKTPFPEALGHVPSMVSVSMQNPPTGDNHEQG
jgi:hypothetical protein